MVTAPGAGEEQAVAAGFLAELAVAEGQPERALRLGGAAAALAASGDHIQLSERGRFER